MLPYAVYSFVAVALAERAILYPRQASFPFRDGFEPMHLQCYQTARKVHAHSGFPVVAGITFLDKADKLYPWPHMVNAIGSTLSEGLIDASPRTMETNLGFIPIRLDETRLWNETTVAYLKIGAHTADAPRWNDELADSLTDRFLTRLRSMAHIMQSDFSEYIVPESIPDASQSNEATQ